jgi:endonuclease YncB( thermonuclease family)
MPPPLPQVTAKVTQVLDGDTIVVILNNPTRQVQVRYLGVNAPELGVGGKPAECYAQQALAYNKDLIGQLPSIVTLEQDGNDANNAPLLRYVKVPGLFINYWLLRQGDAKLQFPSANYNYRYKQLLTQQEIYARTQKPPRGLWGACSQKVGWQPSISMLWGSSTGTRFLMYAGRGMTATGIEAQYLER